MHHNAVLARFKTAVVFKGTILHANQGVGPNGLRQDLVAEIDSAIYIIDSTIPFKNRRHVFEQVKKGKVEKNTLLLHHFASLGFQKVQIVPIVVSSRDAWDPENGTFLKLVAAKATSMS
ncbi:hypothetical protein TNCV_2279731 [Trichonephila clavipes]|uniref:Uncharacterized protein n=1 Tax=Trichonephila clavipes TaxID=2585209 RepID=A0A8X6R5J1_TRICX|nr:hypothetical protein TNCV_2279731 [Trichonephila clavipes]